MRTWGFRGTVSARFVNALRHVLPRSQLAIVPGTGHGLFVEKPDLCNQIVLDFLADDGEAA